MAAMLTTKDNPFDPFDEFEEWKRFDEQNGYFTLSLVARVCKASTEESDAEIERAYEEAIDDIMKYADIGIYEKVMR